MKTTARILRWGAIAVLVLGVSVVSQEIVISELAWAGTAASSYDEWIELRSLSDHAIDLTGWALRIGETIVPLGEAADATVEARTPTLEPGGYLILERTDDDAISDVNADIIYKGSLANGGMRIELVDPTGTVIDWVDAVEVGWPGGGSGDAEVPYCTLERTPSLGWDSNDGVTINGLDAEGNALHGTPGQMNSSEIRAQHEPQVVVEYPNENGVILRGTVAVRWQASDPDGEDAALEITLLVSSDQGETWTLVAERLANTGSFGWDTTAADACEDCMLRIEAVDPDGNTGRSTSLPFAID